jgi:hypothetical protein
VVRLARRFADSGVDAVLVHPPAYFGVSLSPADLRDHYVAAADGSPVPVVVYHIPKFTHVTLEAGLMAELSRHPNIAGIKDSSGDLKRFAEYTGACAKECRLLVGNAAILYAALELGAVGGILALGLLALIANVTLGREPGWWGRRLSELGRVALSGYVTQNLIASALFYGWGLGLFAHVPMAQLPLFVVPAWLLMLIGSNLWLSRFGMGPAEWLWRTLSSGRPQKIRKSS